MKSKLVSGLLLFGLSSTVLSGCGTIMNGSSQKVGFSSSPSSASVTVDGKVLGNTPLTDNISRKDIHTVKIELAGYYPYEMTMTKKTSSWVWGNIIFGGLIGLGVDAISGGLYELTPEQVSADLKKKGVASTSKNDNSLYVSVTLQPDPSWKKIGELTHKPAL
jgi:hypothetical protein